MISRSSLNLNKALMVLLTFFGGMFLGWGIITLEKNLEEFFYQRAIQKQKPLDVAIKEEQILEAFKPLRNWQKQDLEIEARSVISILVDSQTKEKILLGENVNKKLPIASLTKLMTALIVLENYDLSRKTQISETAYNQEGEKGNLKIGETLSVKNLLYITLIESSNDAAYALAEMIGTESFVKLMNLKAKELNLENTHFTNPIGLDYNDSGVLLNYSTAKDLAKLTKYLLYRGQPILWEILSSKEYNLYRPDKTLHHRALSTNKLLGKIQGIKGGKTGWTPRAQECFLLVLEGPKENTFLINIILGTSNKFEKMKKIINWVNTAYRW